MKFCTSCGTEYPDDVLFCQKDGTTLRGSGGGNDLVGQVLAERYHIKKKLGEGGMGQVYLAEHVKMGRRCAVKIMTAGLSNDPEAVGRFNREAANASRIAHPNVCAIYDFGETAEGLIYLAMEFIEGQSLTDFLHDTGPLPLPRAAAILSQAADALQAAHDLGIVHRDLKPDNIMISSVRGRDVVKVVDFGIAKATGSDAMSQKVTRTGLVVGTPEYMSPEQLTGDALDGRSDIYSLGLVFYRMITGVLPFKSDSAQEAMVKRLTEDPAPLAVAFAGGRFPPRLQEVVNHSLARSPMERYGTAAEFGRDVASVAGTMTGTVDTESATQAVKRMSGASATVPQTRIDPMAQVAKPSRGGDTAEARTPSKPVPAQRRSMVVPIAGAAVIVLALGGGAFALRGKMGSPAAVPADTAGKSQPVDTSHKATADTTTRAAADTSGKPPVTPAGNNGGSTTNPGTVEKPAGTTTHNPPQPRGGTSNPPQTNPSTNPTPAKPAVDLEGMKAQVAGYMKNIDFVDDPPQRIQGRQIGEKAYDQADLGATVRAQAAFLVASALLADAGDQVHRGTHADSALAERSRNSAGDWLQKAISLDPKRIYQQALDGVKSQ
ncbi:MAG TPA: protein kinase [Gemmatimonadales bacterium]|nr:protein kinase [Gemmatimonadales bacterium]